MMSPFIWTTFLCLFLQVGTANMPGGVSAVEGRPGFTDRRHELHADLLRNYDTRILPVKNQSRPVPVQYDMSLNQIIELYWKDEFLVWDPEEYSGVKIVYLSLNTIWKPDVVLYNSVDVERTAFEVFPSGVAAVTSDGDVSWFAPVIMQSLCRIKVDLYPFDIQRCPLQFGSWSYNGFKLNLTRKEDKIGMQKYVPSVEWQIVDAPCEHNVVYYDCCPEPYPDVTCYVVMKRRPEFYLFNLVLPTVLLLIIGLLVFCLPPESGEKVSLAITVLLSMTVFMLIVMENVPPSSEAIPLLELFIGGTIVMLTLSTAMAVFVVNLHFRGSYSRPPRWLWSLCTDYMATVCCLRKEVRDLEADCGAATPMSSRGSYISQNGGGGVSLVAMSHVNVGNGNNNCKSLSMTDVKMNGTDDNHRADDRTKRILRDILQEVRGESERMRERHKDKNWDRVSDSQWRIVAMMLDRFFFISLSLLTLVMSLVIFRSQL